MIDLYFAPTPNGWKAAIMLEEAGLDYRPVLMRLSEGDQFSPEFLAISPNAKMPAIVDHAPGSDWGEDPVTVFESGAILLYLAQTHDKLLPIAQQQRWRRARGGLTFRSLEQKRTDVCIQRDIGEHFICC